MHTLPLEAVKTTYKKRVRLQMPPIVTSLLLLAAIVFLVLGWFSFNNVLLGVIACAVALPEWPACSSAVSSMRSTACSTGCSHGTGKATDWFISHKLISFATVAASVGVLVWLMSTTATSLVPNEDTGTIMGVVDMPPATSMERTQKIMNQVDSICGTIPAIQIRNAITGYSFACLARETHTAPFIIKLKPWEERDENTENAQAIVGQLFQKVSTIHDARIMFFQPPMISGYSATNGFEIKLQDKTGGDLNNFFQVYQRFIAALNARPEISMAYSSFNPSYPQYLVELDVAKIKQAGLTQNQILSTLQDTTEVCMCRTSINSANCTA